MNPASLFARPELWPILLLAPLAGLVLFLRDRSGRRMLARVLGPRAHQLAREFGPGRRRIRRVLFSTGLLAALAALLHPVWGEARAGGARKPLDVVVCLDVSRSMLARDLAPSRLTRAQREIRALCSRAVGDRFALVTFAGDARLAIPLTEDLRSFSEMADLADPDSVGRGGTDLSAALSAALSALAARAADAGGAVILLTDGDDPDERGLRAARTCRERNVAVHCVGLGSTRGAKIPIATRNGEAFLRDRAGVEVVSALDARGLEALASAGGGVYAGAGEKEGVLASLYEDRIRPTAGTEDDVEGRRGRENRYQWALLAAFLFFVLELALCERRS